MKKLWQKNNKSKLNPLIESYTVGDDVLWDTKLLPYDIQGSLAHAEMLESINILTSSELKDIEKAFDDLDLSNITLTTSDEDSSTYLENYLVSKIGETGKKIHTGRSRNDQVLVTLRLFEKDYISTTIDSANKLASQLLKLAIKYEWVPLPGYTHGQQAMLSSVGHLFAAYAESLADDADLLLSIQNHIDQNPLGSAASFGVSIPLDRDMTTQKLGFSKTQNNSLYCQNSKGKFEGLVLEGLLQVMMTLSKISSDFIFFVSQECNYFSLSDQITTGSSIMPQKKNPDVFEILRANAQVVSSHHLLIHQLNINLMSGYNRDTQLVKKPLFESFSIVQNSLEVMSIVFTDIIPNEKEILKKISPEIFAADIANDLVKKEGIPFREAYQLAMQKVKDVKIDPKKNLRSKVSPGAPGKLHISQIQKKMDRV